MEKVIKKSSKGYILEVDVDYLKNLFILHNYLPFLPEGKKIEKFHRLVCNIHNKEYIRALKQALNHGLILKKVHKVIQFNQQAWL